MAEEVIGPRVGPTIVALLHAYAVKLSWTFYLNP